MALLHLAFGSDKSMTSSAWAKTHAQPALSSPNHHFKKDLV